MTCTDCSVLPDRKNRVDNRNDGFITGRKKSENAEKENGVVPSHKQKCVGTTPILIFETQIRQKSVDIFPGWPEHPHYNGSDAVS